MLCFNFMRSGNVTSKEFHLLSIVDSLSGESHYKLADYAKIMNSSVRTIKRIIKSLKEKGYINIRYGLYKSIHITVSRIAGILWKPNDKKNLTKSKGPKWSFKRANGVTSNIERNKEINKAIKYPIFKSEELKLGNEMPIEARSMLDQLKSRLGLMN